MRKIVLVMVASVLLGCGSDSDDTKPTPSDSRAEALGYANDNLPCASEADCCVVFDGCRANGLIVALADKDKVAALLASAPDDMCLACISPAVQVKCVSGKCSGVELIPGQGANMEDGEAARKDHCGALPMPTGWSEQSYSVSAPPAGLSPAKVIGCGT